MPITWTVGTSPNAELVNTMLDNAIVLLKENEHPIVHSDRGCHYRWSGWIQRMDEAGLTRSMSKKGCSPDNSACEGFFGRMKNEMFYGEKWDKISVEEFISIINQYMQWYRDKRFKLSLGGESDGVDAVLELLNSGSIQESVRTPSILVRPIFA